MEIFVFFTVSRFTMWPIQPPVKYKAVGTWN